MARLIKALLVLYIGSWFSLVLAQQSVDVPRGPVRIADLGLEDLVPTASDLVGPESGPAGRNRARLVHRLKCWIDGIEGCSVAGRNDPRVREIRQFLTQGPFNRHGAIIIHFPDETRIEVRLERVSESGPNRWNQSVYEPVVLPDSARTSRQ